MSERIVSGSVKADGSVLRGQGFHVARKSAGRYLIVFQPPLIEVAGGMTQLTGDTQTSGCQARVASVDGVHAAISIDGPDAQHVDCDFSFVFSGREHGAAPARHGSSVDPTQVLPEPAIGSPAGNPPVVAFPTRRRKDEDPQAVLDATDASSYAVQVERLKTMMHQVLKPLQRENRMLKSRLDIAARQANGGRRIEPPANAYPQLDAGPLLTRLLNSQRVRSVLDLGTEDLARLALLSPRVEQVTAVVGLESSAHLSPNVTLRRDVPQLGVADGDFDCLIAIDLLQRHPDPQAFLRQLNVLLAEGGTLALAVPALRYPLVTGDLSIWSSGLILYHLAAAGFDCRDVQLTTDDGRIYVLLVKRSIALPTFEQALPPVDRLRPYLPASLEFVETSAGLAFDGDVHAIGWTN
ncbi:class I SAM-dependent methyltransferase [Rhizobium sp. 0TCS1.26]|uniref:class I SAM-dependent methyltransferase n=1 Tax=Rhizobium sp. 0TCS1.26 TaxID=3142623 RepID=UPI003D28E88A